MATPVEELRAALAVAELEEQLAAAKAVAAAEVGERAQALVDQMAASTDPDEIRTLAAELASIGEGNVDTELKLAVREARRVYREMREARPAEEGEARPGAIEAGVAVNTSGVN